MERKEIPPYYILFLTQRDDLIEQLKKHVDEFKYANETKIILNELKDYPEVKRQRNTRTSHIGKTLVAQPFGTENRVVQAILGFFSLSCIK